MQSTIKQWDSDKYVEIISNTNILPQSRVSQEDATFSNMIHQTEVVVYFCKYLFLYLHCSSFLLSATDKMLND